MIDLDLKKRFGGLNKPGARVPSLVKVPRMRFLMIDGSGDVDSPAFQAATKALYGLAFPTKFAAKKRLELRYAVMPLEALYWDPERSAEFTPEMRARAAWRLMIMLPDEISGEFVDEVRDRVAQKKDLTRLADVRVETFSEGLSVQIMHVGPYADEVPTIERLLAFCAEKNLEVTGRHHEIYLGKPVRNDPTKLKTVVRYGVSRQP